MIEKKMSIELKITKREVSGKKAMRKLRHEKIIPGIIYGGDFAPILVSVDEKTLSLVCYSLSFFGHVINVSIDAVDFKVLPCDVSFDAVSEKPLHVDFRRISEDEKVKISIPIEYENEDKCIGIKKGGVLNIVVHKLECYCSPDFIPEKIVIDLAAKGIGESFTIENIALPDGVEPIHAEKIGVLATIVLKKKEKAVDEETTTE